MGATQQGSEDHKIIGLFIKSTTTSTLYVVSFLSSTVYFQQRLDRELDTCCYFLSNLQFDSGFIVVGKTRVGMKCFNAVFVVLHFLVFAYQPCSCKR
jgi:hypothetical protein